MIFLACFRTVFDGQVFKFTFQERPCHPLRYFCWST